MRRSAVLLGLVGALVLAAGCERAEPVDEPKVYDPAIDAPPSTIGVNPNPLLLANQAEIAKRAPKPSALRAPAGPAQASGDAIESVKATLLKMLDAVESGQSDAMMSFFVPEDAATMQSALAAMPALKAKWETLARLVRDKLGVEVPSEQIQMMTGQETMGTPAWMDRATLMAEPSPLQFLARGDKVVVSRGGQEPVTFVNLAGSWKVELTPQERAMIGLFQEMSKAEDAMVDTLTAGINDGTITKDNFQTQMQAQAEAHLAPLFAKLAAAATAAGPAPAPGEAVAAPPGGTLPAPDLTAAGETPAELEVPEAGGELAGPSRLEHVTALWLAGNRNEALGEFVRIDWTKAADFAANSIYGITQLRFAALSGAERDAMTEVAGIQVKALQELTTRLSELATRYAATGKEAKAKEYAKAMADCAQYLQQPNRLVVLREAGAAMAQLSASLVPGPTAPAPTPTRIARPGQGPVDPGYIETVATIWAGKEKEQALKEFTRIDWTKPAVLEPSSIFLVTDEQIIAMRPGAREPKVAEATALDKALRELSQYVLTQARSATQAKDAAKAKRYTDALAAISSFLQQPQHMIVLRSRGDSISRMDNPVTGKPIGTGPPPSPNVVPPAAPAAAPAAVPATAPAPPEEDINAGRGPEAAQELRNRLLAPARRMSGGGN
ncbi:MAG: hypothetical protein MUP47_00710 [Phycisphaerae bacterium]|nr:hypothetical protein [Phycisphaerae bacterium]